MRSCLPSTFFLLAGSAVALAAIDTPVKTDTGLVSGAPGKTAAEVRVFKGIPFAAPPVGDLRWRAPQPAAKWEGVRAGDQFSATCTTGAAGRGGGGGRGQAKGGGAPKANPDAAPNEAKAAPQAARGPAGPGASEDCL